MQADNHGLQFDNQSFITVVYPGSQFAPVLNAHFAPFRKGLPVAL
jgi:hypothetical protein